MKLPLIETTYISAKAPFESSKGVILGCPYDGSASFRPGARFGPSAIRRASWGIETFSPSFQRDLTQCSIHDMGDLELPLGEKEISLGLIRKALGQILSKKKIPILLGGDHLITLPIIEEILPVYPGLHLIHIDAHTDLREDYLGETLSHSTVMRKVVDHLGEGRLFQIGIRSGTEEEFKVARRWKSIVPIDPPALRTMVKRLKNQPVYVTLDLDVIDPGFLPGVGTPEPGGLTFQGVLSLLKALRPLHVVGFDLVELTPDYDPTGISSVTASVILREMILTFS
ncbi:MAG TPA: agmatinase [Thermodesulfobacteriota bacterium]|nr:agmatinase [Thermodesulfobacteriota bacterium]